MSEEPSPLIGSHILYACTLITLSLSGNTANMGGRSATFLPLIRDLRTVPNKKSMKLKRVFFGRAGERVSARLLCGSICASLCSERRHLKQSSLRARARRHRRRRLMMHFQRLFRGMCRRRSSTARSRIVLDVKLGSATHRRPNYSATQFRENRSEMEKLAAESIDNGSNFSRHHSRKRTSIRSHQ